VLAQVRIPWLSLHALKLHIIVKFPSILYLLL